MSKILKDSDLLMAMEMFLDYEPIVYGYDLQYFNSTLDVEDNENKYFFPSELDDVQGKLYIDNSLNEDNLEDNQVEWLKKALYLYY